MQTLSHCHRFTIYLLRIILKKIDVSMVSTFNTHALRWKARKRSTSMQSIYTKNILPSRFGDNHFCSKFVEFIPKFFLIQGNFGIVLDRVILRKGNSWRNSSEGESREAGEEASVGSDASSCRSGEGVCWAEAGSEVGEALRRALGRGNQAGGEAEVRSGGKVGHEWTRECHVCTAGRHAVLRP